MSNRPGGQLKQSDDDVVSKSQLIPIISASSKELIHKTYLIPALITLICVVGMFANLGSPTLFNAILSLYLIIIGYYFIYSLCNRSKPWWLLACVALCTMLILVSPLLPVFILIFREILPGSISTDGQHNFIKQLVSMFFGAGLMEELIKALPVLLLLWIGKRLQSPARERVGVWEPLDGILLGAASGAGFTLQETLGQYVPQTVHEVAVAYDASTGHLLGLQLLIPRVLGSLFGHIAFSGYLGYCIGLAVLKPASRWLILIIGYLTAAGLHAFWNAAGTLDPIFLVIVGGISYLFLAAAILKARQLSLSHSENFVTQTSNKNLASLPSISVSTGAYSLHVGGKVILLYRGVRLRTQEIPGLNSLSSDGIVAEVDQNPRDPHILGLKNLSQSIWTVTLPDGGIRYVNAGQSIRLLMQSRINFGMIVGDIMLENRN